MTKLPYETDIGLRTPTVAIAEALASVKGCKPIDLDCVVHDCVNADSLDKLFAEEVLTDPDCTRTLEFEMAEYVITVESGGTVVVARQSPRLSSRKV